MNINDAQNLKSGDVVFNIFQEELVVNSVHYDEKNQRCSVICINTGLFLESYPSNTLYKSLDDLTLSEYSFLLWARQNKNTLLCIDNDNLDIVIKSYLDGYNQGFSDKPRCSGNKCKGENNVMD